MLVCSIGRRLAILGMLTGIALIFVGCPSATTGVGAGSDKTMVEFPSGGDPTAPVLIKDHIIVVTIGPDDELSVMPETAVVAWEGERPNRESVHPVQVRWILDCVGSDPNPKVRSSRCLRRNETLLFRAKEEQPSGRPDLFQPNKDRFDRAFGIVPGTTSVASGLPRKPEFGEEPLRWVYEVVLVRDGKEVMVLDPDVVVKKVDQR